MKNNYKLGVISDTHGLLREEVLKILSTCDYIIHAGDINDEIILEKLRTIGSLFVVRGNNDKGKWADKLPKELYFTIGEINFYMVHNKKDAAKDLENIDVIIFGHSHKYFCDKTKEVLWLNPGSCGKRRFNLPINMVIITIEDGDYKIDKVDIDISNRKK